MNYDELNLCLSCPLPSKEKEYKKEANGVQHAKKGFSATSPWGNSTSKDMSSSAKAKMQQTMPLRKQCGKS